MSVERHNSEKSLVEKVLRLYLDKCNKIHSLAFLQHDYLTDSKRANDQQINSFNVIKK